MSKEIGMNVIRLPRMCQSRECALRRISDPAARVWPPDPRVVTLPYSWKNKVHRITYNKLKSKLNNVFFWYLSLIELHKPFYNTKDRSWAKPF